MDSTGPEVQKESCWHVYVSPQVRVVAVLQVQVTHMGDAVRRYTVKGLTKDGASSLLFHNKQEDREMSVKEYFEARYRMR